MFKKKVVLAVLAAVVAVGLLAVPVLAHNRGKGHNTEVSITKWGYSGDRPGWGYGDPNHTHFGPPGLGY